MKVHEFIEALKLENQEAEVFVEDWNEEYAAPREAKITGYINNPNAEFLIPTKGGNILLIGA
jgi:hypothetical protein